MNTKYYLIVNENAKGIPKKIGDKQEFVDITEIDMLTQQYRREEILEFLDYKKENQANIDIYIMRVKTVNNKCDVKFYDCIFKESNIDLTPLQKFRLEKIRSLAEDKRKGKIQIGNAPEFKEIVGRLIRSITSDRDHILSRVVGKDDILGPRLNDIFSEIYQTNTIRVVGRFSNEILQICTQYKKLRGLFIAYLSAKRQKLNIATPYKCNRENSLYDSMCFNYNESFFITIDNANNDPHNKFYFDYMDRINSKEFLSMDEATILRELRMKPFDNEKLGQLFKMGGIEAVMKDMDIDEIYASSADDLTKIGIYTERYYLDEIQSQKKRY